MSTKLRRAEWQSGETTPPPPPCPECYYEVIRDAGIGRFVRYELVEPCGDHWTPGWKPKHLR